MLAGVPSTRQRSLNQAQPYKRVGEPGGYRQELVGSGRRWRAACRRRRRDQLLCLRLDLRGEELLEQRLDERDVILQGMRACMAACGPLGR